VERRLLIELGKKLERLQPQGVTWETVIDRWEHDKRTHPTADCARAFVRKPVDIDVLLTTVERHIT
jgi:hypothetical protein